jgi:uncharacterized protein YfaS (alpha-2-macroglobulin family)
MTKSELMTKATRLAKTFVGDWVARMKLALKVVWAMAKKVEKFVMPHFNFRGSEKQISWANDIVADFYANANNLYNHPYWAHNKEVRAMIERQVKLCAARFATMTAGQIINVREKLYGLHEYINNYDCYLSNLENK